MVSLFGPFGSVQGYVSLRQHRGTLDTVPSSLYIYRILASLLALAWVFAFGCDLFGTRIECHAGPKFISYDRLLNSYCWTEGTYTLIPLRSATNHVHSAYDDGRAKVLPKIANHEYDEFSHAHYPFVSVVLALQAVACILPYTIWRRLEDRLVARVICKNICDDRIECKTPEGVALEFVQRRGSFHWLVIKFFFCQSFGLVVIPLQMLALDAFFENNSGNIWMLGLEYLNLYPMFATPTWNVTVTDPLQIVFPRVTKCVMGVFAENGVIVPIDAMCVLPYNLINARIYLGMWFAFVFCLCFTIATIVWYTLLFLVADLRVWLLKTKLPRGMVTNQIVQRLHSMSFPDCFFLLLLSKNVYDNYFAQIVSNLNKTNEELKVICGRHGQQYAETGQSGHIS